VGRRRALGLRLVCACPRSTPEAILNGRSKGNDSHQGIQGYLRVDIVNQLESGDLQAYGIEAGSDAGPILIPRYYFSKTAEVDWDNDTLTALGKKFYEVRIQRERESQERVQGSVIDSSDAIDLVEISAQRDREREQGRLDDILRGAPTTSREPRAFRDQDEREPRHETLPNEPTRGSERQEFTGSIEPESVPELPSTETSPPRDLGRPSKSVEIERAIEILVANGVALAKMPRPKAYRAVRQCAERELG
jgi:hypothetical protein